MDEQEKEFFKEGISEILNDTSAYNRINNFLLAHAGICVSPDSQKWNEIEEFILETLIQED